MSKISFRLHQGGSVKPLEMEYQHLFAIGYAGRNHGENHGAHPRA